MQLIGVSILNKYMLLAVNKMVSFEVLLICAIFSSALCDNVDPLCPIKSDNKGSLLKTIEQWWYEEMSPQKPFKCKIPKSMRVPDNTNKLLSIFSDRFPIMSYPCDQLKDETSIKFNFRGKIIGGRLTGPGKLSLTGPGLSDSSEACLKVSTVLDLKPTEIVGTFVDGALDGNVKIILENQMTIIGFYQNGLANGLQRVWDPQKVLTIVGFYQDGVRIGKCWSKTGNYFIYEDCSTFGRSDEPALTIYANHTDQDFLKVYAGTHLSFLSALEHGHLATLQNIFREDSSCFLEIEATIEEKETIFYLDLLNNEFFDEPSDFSPLCSLGQTENGSVSSNLIGWFQSLNQKLISKQLYQIIWQMKHGSDELQNNATKLIDGLIVDNFNQKMKVFEVKFLGTESRKAVVHSASFDSSHRFHGNVDLSFIVTETKKFGFDLKGTHAIRGYMVHGQLEGQVFLKFEDQRVASISVKNGVIHGPAFIAGTAHILPDRLNYQIPKGKGASDEIGFLGQFSNGKPSGTFWVHMVGGGFMHGQFDKTTGLATGDDLSFIYPDMETAFYGKFEDFVMKKAYEAVVTSIKCNKNGILAVDKFSVKNDGPIFYYQPPTNQSFGAGPIGVVDPYEQKWLKLANSSIPGSGQGVFAVKDIPANRSFSLYSGFIFRAGEEMALHNKACKDNTSRPDDERRHCKKYSLGFVSFEAVVDILPEDDKPDVFHPTIGPKVNHHFSLNNSVYTEMEHPRWGAILSVKSMVPIKAGTEIFSYYGYKKAPFPNDFPWYFKALEKYTKEEKKKKKSVKHHRFS